MYTQYWTLSNTLGTYPHLPAVQIVGQPIPTTWASVGASRARELGAQLHRRDILPQYYAIPDGVDPYTVAEVDGVQMHTLDLTQCTYDEAAATAAHGETIRAERDRRMEIIRWRVERNQSEQRLGRTPTEEGQPLDYYMQQLRDLPEQEGFPWNGDINKAPWPTAPQTPTGSKRITEAGAKPKKKGK